MVAPAPASLGLTAVTAPRTATKNAMTARTSTARGSAPHPARTTYKVLVDPALWRPARGARLHRLAPLVLAVHTLASNAGQENCHCSVAQIHWRPLRWHATGFPYQDGKNVTGTQPERRAPVRVRAHSNGPQIRPMPCLLDMLGTCPTGVYAIEASWLQLAARPSTQVTSAALPAATERPESMGLTFQRTVHLTSSPLASVL